MVCYKLQIIFAKHFLNQTPGLHLITDEIVAQSKSLLLHNSSELLSLSNWENFFPLSHTLLTPKILLIIKKNPAIANCPWCSQFGTLEHCLFECLSVKKACSLFERDNKSFLGPWSNCVWCFGALKCKLNLIVWVINFAIYKACLQVIDSHKESIYQVISSECGHYEYLFPVLSEL